MATELSTLFASSVRDIVPDVLRRHLAYRYREHGCDWIWEDEGRRLESSLHRLFVAAVDLLDHGFIGFQASARPRRSGGAAVKFARVPAAGFVFSVHYPLHRAEHDAQGAPPLLLRKAPRR